MRHSTDSRDPVNPSAPTTAPHAAHDDAWLEPTLIDDDGTALIPLATWDAWRRDEHAADVAVAFGRAEYLTQAVASEWPDGFAEDMAEHRDGWRLPDEMPDDCEISGPYRNDLGFIDDLDDGPPNEKDERWYAAKRTEGFSPFVRKLYARANLLIDDTDEDLRGLGEEIARIADRARGLDAKGWSEYSDRLAAMLDSAEHGIYARDER